MLQVISLHQHLLLGIHLLLVGKRHTLLNKVTGNLPTVTPQALQLISQCVVYMQVCDERVVLSAQGCVLSRLQTNPNTLPLVSQPDAQTTVLPQPNNLTATCDPPLLTVACRPSSLYLPTTCHIFPDRSPIINDQSLVSLSFEGFLFQNTW